MKLQEVILRNYRGFRISLQYIIAAREKTEMVNSVF